MPSIIPGYEYDIFISYRQNDNRSGWVTEFVNALQDELAATIKDPVSIYFDSNPHDGLHDTHDVDGSLKEKVKCLIFIPIVSRTYCDPKAFAWQKEFLPFLDFAKLDKAGLDIPLKSGNVMKRVLAVRIHDVDNKDTGLFEKEISGVMRPVDFIYKETGVNRPLEPSDSSERNLNKILFRNQVNKLAIAIMELIEGIQIKLENPENEITEPKSKGFERPPEAKPARPGSNKIRWIGIPALLVLMALLYFLFQYKSLNTSNKVDAIDKSIAVLPFVNMSNDPEQQYFSDGISEELINALAKMKNLKVAGRTSSFSYRNRDEDLRKVGENLGVSNILEGSVRKSGNTVRITAQLIDVRNGFHLWTETYDRELSDIFKVQDEITAAIIKELRVRLSPEENVLTRPVNVEAYPFYLKARQKLAQRGIKNLIEASELFYEALRLDSSYSRTYSGLSKTLSLLNNYSQGDRRFNKTHEESYTYAAKALELDPDNAEAYMAIGIAKCWYDWEWSEAEEYLNRAVEMNPNDAEINNFIGDLYRILCDYKKSEKYELRALELDPLHAVNHWDLGETYLRLNELEKAKSYFRSGFAINPALVDLLYPSFITPLKNDHDFWDELESAFNGHDLNDVPEPIQIQIKACFAIIEGDLAEAEKHISELERFAEEGLFSYSYLFDFNYLMGNEEKAAFWASKAVQSKDGLLTYQSLATLPEHYQSDRIRKILTSAKLDALYEIRRKNLSLK